MARREAAHSFPTKSFRPGLQDQQRDLRKDLGVNNPLGAGRRRGRIQTPVPTVTPLNKIQWSKKVAKKGARW